MTALARISYAAEADAALARLRADLAASRRVLDGEIIEPGEPGADIVFSPSPFQTRTQRYTMAPGCSVEDAIDIAGIGANLRRHIGVFVDDVRIPRERWALTRPAKGQVVQLRVELAGGGRNGKNPLRAVLTIALVVVATIVAPHIGWLAAQGAVGLGASVGVANAIGAVVGVAATAAIITAGQALIGALIPPPSSKSRYSFDQQPGNPYASITGLRNQAVPYGPIPRVIGKRRLFPMLAARPFTEMQGNTQYLRMLLLAGYGPLRISDIRIGQTPISAFAGAEYEVREGWENDAAPTLYTGQISEESLSVLLLTSIANVRTSQTGTREISVDVSFPQGLATYDDNGNRKTRTVQFSVEYSTDAGATWNNAEWIDGQSAHGTGTNGKIIASAASAQTVVRSGRFPVPVGQVQVRVTRLTAIGGARDVDTAYWTVLRSIKTDAPVSPKGLCLISVRLKATAQLNGVPDQINCIAESYLPVRDANTGVWSWEISRSPAWGYVDTLRRRGLTTILADDRFRWDDIHSWATDCALTAPNASEPRNTCDIVIEGGAAFSNAQMIASHGRAKFTLVDGAYSVVREVQQTVPVQHISPRNAHSYRGLKAFVDIPHAFRCKFINPDKDYQEDEVVVYRDEYNRDGSDGKTAASKFDTLSFPGCTSATQAWREGRYHLAVLLLRPEEHSVSMDVEAIKCTRGDLVRFSYDVVSIGLGEGRISACTADASNVTHLTLDAPVDMEDGVSYAVRVRHADGSSSVHALAAQIGAGIETVELATPVAIASAPATGDMFQFGVASLETAPMLVSRIDPAEGLNARVTLVDAQSGVYSADTGTIPAFNSYITNPALIAQQHPDAPTFSVLSDISAVERYTDGTLIERIKVSLHAPGASSVRVARWQVEWRLSSTQEWISAGEFPVEQTSAFLAPIDRGENYDIRARVVSSYGVESEWTELLSHTATGLSGPPPDVTGFLATAAAEGVDLTWNAVAEIDLAHYRVKRGGADWASASVVADVSGMRLFAALTAATTFWIKAVNKVGVESANAASVTASPDGAALADLLSTEQLAELVLSLQARVDETRAYAASLVRINDLSLGTHLTAMTTQQVDGDAAIVQTLDLIGAKTDAGAAFLFNLDTTKVGASETLAQRFTSLSAADTTNANNISATSSAVSILEARVTSVEGVNTSQASSITSLNSSLSSTNSNVSANASAISGLDTRVTSAEGTITSHASSITSLNSTVGSHSTTITQHASSINGLSARWGVRIEANGRVSGILLNDDGSQSDFVIVADKFKLVDPGAPAGASNIPFSYSAGVLKMVSVEVDTIKANTIVGGHIQAGAISGSHIQSGAISGSHVAPGAISGTASAFTAAEGVFGGDSTWQTVQSVSLSTDGSVVTVNASFNFWSAYVSDKLNWSLGTYLYGARMPVRLTRDGSAINTRSAGAFRQWNDAGTLRYGDAGEVAFTYVDSPSAGSHTYALQVQALAADTETGIEYGYIYASNRSLSAQEVL